MIARPRATPPASINRRRAGAGPAGLPAGSRLSHSCRQAHCPPARRRRRLNKSRSQLYTEALSEYLARRDPDTITEALNSVVDELEAPLDPGIAAAASMVLERVER